MATYFSDNYTDVSAGSLVSSLPTIPQVNDSSKAGRLRYKRSEIRVQSGFDPAAGAEIFRMGTFKSSDRLIAAYISTSVAAGNSTLVNIGAYLSGSNHDGAVIDVDCFAVDIELNAKIARTEYLAGDVADTDFEEIGLPLWQQVSLSAAGTYTADPGVDFDIALTTDGTTHGAYSAAQIIVCEFYYHSGD